MTSESASFSLSVDRPDDGPIVVSVRGALVPPTNARFLADCLTAIGAADRPAIVDLTDVTDIGSDAVDVIVAAARRVSCRGFRLTVVPSVTADEYMRALAEHVHIECPGHSSAMAARTNPRTVDALHGTYL
ncbi:STAS domain-containing protein [Rhodococcus sp. NPDC078407]|uniref:STAS domain-containing protein n=1 Tax=Rhodococcus sp. NPDC078407 TaxID=3364509 RepID=UPI0037C73AF9